MIQKILCGLILLKSCGFWAQTTTADSLYLVVQKEIVLKNQIDLLNDYAVKYKTKDFATSVALAEKALKLAEKENYPDGMAIAYRNMGIVATNQSRYDEAFGYYNKAIKLTKTPKILGQLYGSLARTYSEVSNFEQALNYLFQSLEAFETAKDLQLQYITLYNISNAYIQFNNVEKYNEYKNKALALKNLIEQQNESTPKTATPIPIENAVKLEPNLNHKADFYKQEIVRADQQKNAPEKAEALLKQAKIDIGLGHFKQAITELEQALEIEQNLNNSVKIADVEKHLADAYLEIGKKNRDRKSEQKAVELYQRSIEVFEKNSQYLNASEASRNLSLVYVLLGDYKKAYVFQEKSMLFYEQMFSSKTKESLKNIEDRYIIESKNKQLRIRKLELENQKKRQLILYVVVVGLLLIGFLLFYQSWQRKKNNAQLRLLNQDLEQANRNKTRFFSILNHDLRAPVSNLIHFLHLQKENPEMLDIETKIRLEKKTISGAEDLLSSMEDILLWSKSQMEQFQPKLKPVALSEVFNDTKKVFSGYMNIEFRYDIDENLLAHTDENCLKTIIRNLTSNAINAFSGTEKPSIHWHAQKQNNQVILTITDNGPGAEKAQFNALFDSEQNVGIKSGLGLHLVRDLAKAINAEIEVKSIVGQGTTIRLYLPTSHR